MNLYSKNNLFRKAFLLLITPALLFSISISFAQAESGVPSILSYQGRLTDSSGNLLGGAGTPYFFKFSFWDSATVGAGSQVWPVVSPNPVSLTVKQGVFNVNIGDIENSYPDILNYNFGSNKKIYLQVEASANNSSFETLSPRQRITSAPFAEVAGSLAPDYLTSIFSNYFTKTESNNLYDFLGAASTTASTTIANHENIFNHNLISTALQGFTESDPIWNTASTSLSINNFATSSISQWLNDSGYLTSFSESDPFWNSTSWSTTTNNSANWNNAFSWGSHVGLYDLLGTASTTASSTLANWLAGNPTSGTNTGDNAVNSLYSGLAASKQDALNGTGFIKANGTSITYDNNTYLTAETDPTFTAWDKHAGISITESQISDLQSYITSSALTPYAKLDGTNQPFTKGIQVTGSTDMTQFKILANATQTSNIMDVFASDGTTARFHIKGDGNVGIGTTTPATLLDVNGILTVGTGSGATRAGTIKLGDGSFTKMYGLAWTFTGGLSSLGGNTFDYVTVNGHADVPAGALIIKSRALTGSPTNGYSLTVAAPTGATNNYAAVFTGGNVGIGTTSPGYKLDVVGDTMRLSANMTDATAKSANFVTQHYTNTEEPVLGFRINSYGTGNIVTYGGGSASYNAATTLAFYTAANDTTLTGTERLRIQSDGNVGIGTTAPVRKLDVIAPVGSSAFIGGVDDGILFQTAAGLVNLIGVNQAANAYNDIAIRASAAGSGLYINTSGNVGIGTTTPTELLNIYSLGNSVKAKIKSGLSGGSASVQTINDANKEFKFGITGSAFSGYSGIAANEGYILSDIAGSNFVMSTANNIRMYTGGGLRFQTSYLGTNIVGNGNTTGITLQTQDYLFNPTVTILDNGKVGIGTTSPTTKLHLAGTTASDYLQIDAGLNFLQVSPPNVPVMTLIATPTGNIPNGIHYYHITYVTALGETQNSNNTTGITTDDTHKQITITIPVSTDYRVTKRRIYRGPASNQYAPYLLAEISNNTDVTYIDNKADTDLVTPGAYRRPNTTNNLIRLNGTKAMTLDIFNTTFGLDAGTDMETSTGALNTLFGASAGHAITTGSNNTVVGMSSLSLATTGGKNQILGDMNLYKANTTNNQIIGSYVGYSLTSATNNVIIGGMGNTNSTTTNISGNVLIGTDTGYNMITNSNYNIFLGFTAGKYETGSNKLIFDNIDRTTEALGRTSSLIYGITNATPANQILSLGGGGKVGIGTTTPGQALTVVGNGQFTAVGSGASANDLRITADGTLTTSASDIALKMNLVPLNATTTSTSSISILDKVIGLKPYTFNWRSEPDGPKDIGLIAQDVEGIFPEITFTNKVDGYKGINYSRLPVILVSAIQELSDKVVKVGSYVVDGVAHYTHVIAVKFTGEEADIKKIKSEQICLGETCIDETVLKEIILKNSVTNTVFNPDTVIDTSVTAPTGTSTATSTATTTDTVASTTETIASTTPEIIPEATSTATTTEPVITPVEIASSTEPVATTTPEVIPEIVSTTTEPVI